MVMADMSFEDGVQPEAGDGDTDVVLSNAEIATAFQVILESLGKLQFCMLRMNLRIGKTDEVIDLMLLGLKLHRERVKRLQSRFEGANRKLEHKRKKGEGEVVQAHEEQRYISQEDYMMKLQKRLLELERAVAAEGEIGKVLNNDRNRNTAVKLFQTQNKRILRNKLQSTELMLKSNDKYSITRYSVSQQERRKLDYSLNQKIPISRKAVHAFKQHVCNNENAKSFVVDKQKQEQVSDTMPKSKHQDSRKEMHVFKPKQASFENKSPVPLKQKREHIDSIQNPKTPISCKDTMTLKSRRLLDEKLKPPSLPKQKQDHDDIAHKQKMLISRKDTQSLTQKCNLKDQDKHLVSKEQKQEQPVDNTQKQKMHVSRKDMQTFKQKSISDENNQCVSPLKHKKEQQIDHLSKSKFNIIRKEMLTLKQKMTCDENDKCFSPGKQKKEQPTLSKVPISQKEAQVIKRRLASEENEKHLNTERQNQEHICEKKKQRMLEPVKESKQLLLRIPCVAEDEQEIRHQKDLVKQTEHEKKKVNSFGRKRIQTAPNMKSNNELCKYKSEGKSSLLLNGGCVMNQRISIPRIVLSSSEISVTSNKMCNNHSAPEQDSNPNGFNQSEEVHRSMIMKIPERALTSHEMRAVAQLFRQNDNEQKCKSNSVRNLLNVLEKMVISVQMDTPKLAGPQQLQIEDVGFGKPKAQDSKKIMEIPDDLTNSDKLNEHPKQENVQKENKHIVQIKNKERTYSPKTMLKMFENSMDDDEETRNGTIRDEFQILEKEKQKIDETLDASRENGNQTKKVLAEFPHRNSAVDKTPSDAQMSSASSVVATATFPVEHPTPALQECHQATAQVVRGFRPTLSTVHQSLLRRLRRIKVSHSLSHDSDKIVSSKPTKCLGRQLLKATQDGSLSEVRRLLKQGAEPNFLNRSRWSPLHMAARKCYPEIISTLLKKGASVNARTSYGLTALHIAAFNDKTGRCVTNLIKAGAHLNSSNKFGRTPLHIACICGNVAALCELLDAGASKTLRNDAGKLPLDVAKNDTIRQLLSQEKTKKK